MDHCCLEERSQSYPATCQSSSALWHTYGPRAGQNSSEWQGAVGLTPGLASGGRTQSLANSAIKTLSSSLQGWLSPDVIKAPEFRSKNQDPKAGLLVPARESLGLQPLFFGKVLTGDWAGLLGSWALVGLATGSFSLWLVLRVF